VKFRELLQIERCQQDELQLLGFRARRERDLQHRGSGQPAEHRFQRHHLLGDQGLLEIIPIVEIEGAVGLQRVAEQHSIRIDRQYPGILLMLLANGGQESRARRLVAGVEIAGARQSIVQLRGALDLLVEII
jgi:hypothetical protein